MRTWTANFIFKYNIIWRRRRGSPS